MTGSSHAATSPPLSILAVVGPTATGKTSLAIELAERLDTEIISADSMQVYKGMAIGTAAPTPDEQARVKHHFVGFLEPGQTFSAGRFEREARAIVARLNASGRAAVVASGSGLYVRALIDGLFTGPAKDDAIRERLRRQAVERGVPALYAHLEQVDPEYADVIHNNDLRRIVRALEVFEITGRPLSALHRVHRESAARAQADAPKTLQVALQFPRADLYARINDRVDRILDAGFVDEVRSLLEAGHEAHLLRVRSLGYREFMTYLRGHCSFDEAAEAMKQNTRRFAKRQLTWFRADSRVQWLPAAPATPPAAYVESVLSTIHV